jgi:hypothetical protein
MWQLMASLFQAWDIATDPVRQASPLWFPAVADVTDNLLTELHGTGREVDDQVVADGGESSAVPAPEAAPSQPEAHGHGLDRAINRAASKLEELAIQGHVTWTKRQAGASSSSAAEVEALMVRTVRILARCMELQLLCSEDSPGGGLKGKMCPAVLCRVAGRCTIAVEFRRSIQALQSGVFEIKLGSNAADATFRVKLDAVWPSPSDLQRSCFSLRKVDSKFRSSFSVFDQESDM